MKVKCKMGKRVRDLQVMEEPKERFLPEQKGPQPALARGAKREHKPLKGGRREVKTARPK